MEKKQGGGNDSGFVITEHEYILCIAKNISKYEMGLDISYQLDDKLYPMKDDKGEYGLITLDKASIQISQSLIYEIIGPDGEKYYPRIVKGKQSCWRWSKEKVEKQFDDLVFKKGKVYTKYYRPPGITPKSLLIDAVYGRTESGNDDIKEIFESKPFAYPKPILLIRHLLSISTKKASTILDFFAGSGTTLHATMKLNAEDGGHRQCILVQQREGDNNICENVTYERNRRVMCGFINAKGEQVEGLGGRLKYYRTAFVGKHTSHNAIDADRVELSRKAGYLLALGENTLEEIAHTDTYQIFADTRRDDVNIVSESNSLASCYTAIYFTENYAKMPEFVAEIDKLRSAGTCNPQINVYIFCWGTPEIFEGEFDDLRGISLKAIPQPILDVYKSINQ